MKEAHHFEVSALKKRNRSHEIIVFSKREHHLIKHRVFSPKYKLIVVVGRYTLV
jgi:hypothetical protein